MKDTKSLELDRERKKKLHLRKYPLCPKCKRGDMLEKKTRYEDGSEDTIWKCSYCDNEV